MGVAKPSSIGLAVGLLTLTTALLMHEQQTPDATAVQSHYGWWVDVALMAGVLLLPLLGFDDGSRPELNWVLEFDVGLCCGFSCLNMLRSCCFGSWFAIMATTPLLLFEESVHAHSSLWIAVLSSSPLLFVLISGEDGDTPFHWVLCFVYFHRC